MAVRAALGAGRNRLLRQMLTESVVLAGAGGLLGVLLALVATPLVGRLVPTALPIAALPPMDPRVLAFATALTVATGIAFGIAPALRGSRDPGPGGLQDDPRVSGGAGRERARAVLVVAEVAVSVVLLVSAGLRLRAAWRVQSVDPGFRVEGVLTARTTLPLPKYARVADRQRFYDQVLAEVRALPGVRAAGYISFLPMVMRGGIWVVQLEGRAPTPCEDPSVSLRYVTSGLFEALGAPLIRGRRIEGTDTAESPRVAVVSESFVRELLPGRDPIGLRFTVAFQERTIVGVVGDVRVRGLEQDSEPQVYLPSTQVADNSIIYYTPKDLVIRASGPLEALPPAVRAIVARADPQQPVSDVRTLAEVVAGETAPRLAQVRVLAAFAGAALLLAGVGLHGLLAFTVAMRAREIGVRVALGAATSQVVGLVLGQGARLAMTGIAAGLVLSWMAGRALAALLAGVSPHDPPSLLAAACLALAVALAGAVRPAWRAARLDPSITLRAQ
jgi:predicted permease